MRNPSLTPHHSNINRLGIAVIADGPDAVAAAARQNFFLGASQLKLANSGGVVSTMDPLHTRQYTMEEAAASCRASSEPWAPASYDLNGALRERSWLFEISAEGVVLLSGNVHFAELSRTHEGPYPLYDLTSSGLTHVNQEYPKAPNSYRAAGPFAKLNFGLVEIDWEVESGPRVSLQVRDINGAVTIDKTLALGELGI